MDEKGRLPLAEELAAAIRSYGPATIATAEVKSGDGAQARVVVRMKDGLTFNLPADFNPKHIETVLAIAAAARVKGREETELIHHRGSRH